MTELYQHMPDGNLSVQQAKAIYAANPDAPLSREAAAAELAKRGIHPPNADGSPNYGPAIQLQPEAAYPQDAPFAPAAFAKMALPPSLAAVVAADLAANTTVDPAAVEQTYKHSARSYGTDLAAAAALLAHAGVAIKPEQLPAATLRHLAIWAGHVSNRQPKP